LKYNKEIAIISGLFVIAIFVGVNMMTSTSYPGIAGGNLECWNCHNGPIFATENDFSVDLGSWPSGTNAFPGGRYTANYFFTMSTNAAAHSAQTEPFIDHVYVSFTTNATHIMVSARVTEGGWNDTANAYEGDSKSFGDSVTPDQIALIWGDNTSAFDLQEFSKQGMNTGKSKTVLDLWWVSTADFTENSTGLAKDYRITEGGKLADDVDDVHVGVHWGVQRGNMTHPDALGYYYLFSRALDTGDAKDIQFEMGKEYYVALAHWNDAKGDMHYSSYNERIIIGDEAAPEYITETDTVTEATTVVETNVVTTTAAATGDGFTLVFVMVGLLIAIPIVAKKRN
jgi:hypothetical protein